MTTALLLTVSFGLGACGGGGNSAASGVASLGEGQTPGSTATADGTATEEEVLAWVQCMREQGVDMADPTVDADGNLVLGGGPGGRPPGASPGGNGATTGTRPDRAKMEAAQETCGQRPRTGGGFSEEDRQASQDSMLKMTQCLREQGLEVADPDFSSQGPGGRPPDAGSSGNSPGAQPEGRGPFGGLDMQDATVQAAFEKCRTQVGGSFPGPGGGGAPAAPGQS